MSDERLLDPTDLEEIVQILIGLQTFDYMATRNITLSRIELGVRSRLKEFNVLDHQLRSDIELLHGMRLRDGSRPFIPWLEQVVAQTRPFKEAAKLEVLLAKARKHTEPLSTEMLRIKVTVSKRWATGVVAASIAMMALLGILSTVTQTRTLLVNEGADGSVTLSDISFAVNVVTLDNLKLSLIESDIRKHSEGVLTDEQFRQFVKGFSTDDNLRDKRNYDLDGNPSFERFSQLLDDVGKDDEQSKTRYAQLRPHFDTISRREAVRSPDYWNLRKKEIEVYVLPRMPQFSIAVLTIQGVANHGHAKLYASNADGDGHYMEIELAKRGREMLLNPIGSKLQVCMYTGDRLEFESRFYRWSIVMDRVVNPLDVRGDVTDWAEVTCTNQWRIWR